MNTASEPKQKNRRKVFYTPQQLTRLRKKIAKYPTKDEAYEALGINSMTMGNILNKKYSSTRIYNKVMEIINRNN